MRSENCQIGSEVKCDICDNFIRGASLDDTNNGWIFYEFIGRKVRQLISRPLPHLVETMNEVALSNGPFNSVIGLDDIEHVKRGVENSLQIERIVDDSS